MMSFSDDKMLDRRHQSRTMMTVVMTLTTKKLIHCYVLFSFNCVFFLLRGAIFNRKNNTQITNSSFINYEDHLFSITEALFLSLFGLVLTISSHRVPDVDGS